MRIMLRAVLVVSFCLPCFVRSEEYCKDYKEYVVQSARTVPVAHEVDLLVLGGTTGGVVAACEAKRAIAMALENIGGPDAAKMLAELLDKPGVRGYVHDSIETAMKFDRAGGVANTNLEKPRRDSMIEISLSRALYRCGDVDGKGEEILKAYTKDFRGHFARHATEVLKEGNKPVANGSVFQKGATLLP